MVASPSSRTLSGRIAHLVGIGALIRTGDLLDRLGADHLKDGHRSWCGRHASKAYRTARLRADAIKVWTRHPTTGKWIHGHVYAPTGPALYAALQTYTATRHLATSPPRRRQGHGYRRLRVRCPKRSDRTQ